MQSDRTRRQIERLLEQAEEAIGQLSWQVVRDRAQAVLALDPESHDARSYLAAADRALAMASNTSPGGVSRAASLIPQEAFSDPVAFAEGLAELLLEHYPEERADALDHLDFAIEEFRAMKMQPALERALGHKGLLKA
jgi:hypothetical protein